MFTKLINFFKPSKSLYKFIHLKGQFLKKISNIFEDPTFNFYLMENPKKIQTIKKNID